MKNIKNSNRKVISIINTLVIVTLVSFFNSPAWAQERPNILLIIADDLGYGDLGVYGGDINTPNIDALANAGQLFTQFHTAPTCAVTRAMLLSGNNNNVAGLAVQGTNPGPVIPGLAGYENALSDRVALLPQLLQDVDYRTYIAGKWHLGEEVEHLPKAAGFGRSFVMEFGAGNHFNDVGLRGGGSRYWNGNEQVAWPDGGYSTEVYTNKLLEYLEADKESDEPFFMIAAYTSPHWPLQVPEDELNLYSGRYDMGYDALREQRFASLKSAGIIPADSLLPPRNDAIILWSALSPEQQRNESRKMELYAAMVDNLDGHVGRLIEYLRTNNLFDNTLIVFMADNGAAGEDFYNRGPFIDFVRSHHNNSYENMGKPDSWVAYGPQWAEAGSAPFKRYKGFTTEGGIIAPMIISGPGVNSETRISDTYIAVPDLTQTFLDLAGGSYPDDKAPMIGESAWPYLSGATDRVHDGDYVTVLTQSQRAFVRQGDWKLVSIERPFDERNFTLHNLKNDPGEVVDLSESNPEKRANMIKIWREKRREYGIVLPEDL
ncbi:MAG: arylsulfatase [Arenicellaceae bacterium]|nr:arylsulfatase [Arenicellaceae bacterium]